MGGSSLGLLLDTGIEPTTPVFQVQTDKQKTAVVKDVAIPNDSDISKKGHKPEKYQGLA